MLRGNHIWTSITTAAEQPVVKTELKKLLLLTVSSTRCGRSNCNVSVATLAKYYVTTSHATTQRATGKGEEVAHQSWPTTKRAQNIVP